MSRVLRITDANTRKISNAVFDNWTSGAPTNWTSTGSPTTTQVVSEGTIQTFASAYALDIQNASTQAVRGWYQDITDVVEGQTYYISVYVKPTTGILRLYAWDGGGTSNAVFVESTDDTEWQQLIVEKVAGSGGIRVGLIAFDASSQGVFDLVQLATFNIEFIEGVYSSFFRVTNWEIQVPDYKGGGVFASSPVAEGQKLIDGYWDNVTQTITFHLRGDSDANITDQNAAANKLGELFQALQAARDFSKTSWVRDPVYMQFKAENETNYRYAFIANARIPQLADMYNIEFKQLVMLDLDLIIEHPVAFGMPPGEGAPVLSGVRTTYNSQDYGNYDDNGIAEDNAELVYFGSRHGLCNITNMHQGTGGANQMGGSLPRVIVTSGGTVYFGINTSLADSGPFLNIIFHISRAAVGTSTGVWEYWGSIGPGWSAFGTPTDTSDGFTKLGWQSISHGVPSTWIVNSPGGGLPTGYWMRFRHTGSWSTTPQIDREIFTINRNYLEFSKNAVQGNIVALAEMWARNVTQGVGGGAQIDGLIGGLRSVSRGADFQSIINLGGKQNHSDITITYDTGVSSVANLGTEGSTGYVARSTAAAEKFVEISIGGDLASQYVGEFRAFSIIEKNAAAITQSWIQYKQSTGMPFETNEKFECGSGITIAPLIFDLGIVSISADVNGGVLPDNITLRVYTDTDTTNNLDRCSLVLIPVDEYQFDARPLTEYQNDSSRWFSGDVDSAYFGSVRFVKSMFKTNFVLTSNDSELAKMRFTPRSNGPMVLQQGEQQRMYFLPMIQRSTDPLRYQFKEYYLIGVRPFINPRYLGMRGSN